MFAWPPETTFVRHLEPDMVTLIVIALNMPKTRLLMSREFIAQFPRDNCLHIDNPNRLDPMLKKRNAISDIELADFPNTVLHCLP